MHIISRGKRYHKAAREANLQVLKEANRWELNVPDENGMTPLLVATHEGHVEAVGVVLKRKGKLGKVDLFGNSALHLAAARGHLECVKLILRKGGNLYALDAGGRTACDLAKIGCWEEVVEFLEYTAKLLEERNPKLVKKLKDLASKRHAEMKTMNLSVENNVVVKYEDEFGEQHFTDKEEEFKIDGVSESDESDIEDNLSAQQHDSKILGLIQHKSGGLSSSTTKSTARSFLVLSELIKEQSINETIVNRVEARPKRKPIKSTDPDVSDEEESDLDEDPSADSLLAFLQIYNLQRFYQLFQAKSIDLNGLMLMTEQDVKALELPLGPHRKLYVAVQEYKSARKWSPVSN